MGGMTMWIILGGLIGLVVIFLVVTSVLDRKKRRKVMAEKAELDVKVGNSGANVSKAVMKVVRANEKLLTNFVPSVGKTKMSDINNKAKAKLIEIRNSEDFKLLRHNEEEDKSFSDNLEALIHEKSNNWSKRNISNIEFFKEYKKQEPKKDESKKEKSKAKKKGKK